MRIERTFNVDLVRTIWTHPRIWPHISDDGAPDPRNFDPSPLLARSDCYFLTPVGDAVLGLFFCHPHNCVTWELHTAMLPAFWGPPTQAAVALMVAWMFQKTPCRKLITHIPENNRLARRLAERTGFSWEGVNRASFLQQGKLLDQYLYGLTKE